MGEQKQVDNTPRRGNPSPESTYLPTHHQVLALLVPQVPSSRRCPPSLCPYSPFLLMTDLGTLDVRHGVAAGTQRLSASCYQKCL